MPCARRGECGSRLRNRFDVVLSIRICFFPTEHVALLIPFYFYQPAFVGLGYLRKVIPMNQTKTIALVVLILTVGLGMFLTLRFRNPLFLVIAAVLSLPDISTLLRKSDNDRRK